MKNTYICTYLRKSWEERKEEASQVKVVFKKGKDVEIGLRIILVVGGFTKSTIE